MSTQNPNVIAQDGAEELRNLYTGLIGGTAFYEAGFDVWGKHAEAWGETAKFEITQGSITGTFARDDVEFEMGSQTAALRVAANVRTAERQQRLDLFLRGTEPAFSIRSLVEQPKLHVEPTTPNYVQFPTEDAFDWDAIVSNAAQLHELDSDKPLYLVVFRSQLKAGVDTSQLITLDTQAHHAAQESPALLYYFGGEPDEVGRALSFCLWSDEAEAKAISRDSRHQAATQMVQLYESYSLEKYDVHYQEEKAVLAAK